MVSDVSEWVSISKDVVRQARQADLAGYLLRIGVSLVADGKRYRHTEHDSLIFTNNAYFWNSRQDRGNSSRLPHQTHGNEL